MPTATFPPGKALTETICMRIAEIIDCLLDYDSKKPSKHSWGRKRTELEVEWVLHNIAYEKSSNPSTRNSSKHVDLDHNIFNNSFARILWNCFFDISIL